MQNGQHSSEGEATAHLTAEDLAEQLDRAHARIAELEARVGIDTLTDLPRRTVLEAQARIYQAKERPFALCMFDLDGFKRVNDLSGHTEGDRLLRAAADVLREIRSADGDMVARWGGDEFVVLLRERIGDAQRVAERLRQNVFDAVCNHGAGCSVGVATWPRDGATFEAVLDLADRRMYLDKDARRRA
jgi:diguanylate cyclase (GGDEF)-like protein